MFYDKINRKWVAEAIINGRKYSTETSKLICWENSPIYPEDWGAIYKKKTGEFFFVESFCKGYYPKSWQYCWEKSEHLDMFERRNRQITPLTIEEAKMAIEEWCSANDYEELFGEVEE